MIKKHYIPNLIKCNNCIIKRVFPMKDNNLIEELILLYSKNEKHLYFFHKGDSNLIFNNVEDYIHYLYINKKMCYVLILSGKIVGCIEITHLSTDNDYLNYRTLSYWIDKSNIRKGIMFNALSSLENAFRKQALDYFEAYVDLKNEQSVNLLKKLNYTKVTRYSTMIPESGEIVDYCTF